MTLETIYLDGYDINSPLAYLVFQKVQFPNHPILIGILII